MSDLPEWSAAFDGPTLQRVTSLPLAEVRDWALGGATGAGVRVAIVDSGVDADHPRVGGVTTSVEIEVDPDSPEGYRVNDVPHADLVGHGTACAAIIRSIAPDVELHSIRVLGANLTGRGSILYAGIAWAVDHRMQVVNLSLSSKSEKLFAPLHRLADEAYFNRSLLVSAANNQPGPTYPSEFSSVVSVAARPGDDPMALAYNPRPPVEFGARGIDVDVAWADGGSITATGNSFAAPHVAGIAALILSKHRLLNPFQVKSVLQALCSNADPD